MKLKSALATVSLGVGFIAPAAWASPSICDSPGAVANLETQAADPANAFSLESFRRVTEGQRVLLVGDAHYILDPGVFVHLMHAMKAVKGGNSCIAFEFEKQDGPALDFFKAFFGRRLAYAKAVAQSTEATDQQRYQAEQIEKNARENISYFGPLLLEAQKIGLRSITVDSVGAGSKELTITQRNADMALNLKQALASGCGSVMFIVGKSHLAHVDEMINSIPTSVDMNVKEHLTRLGINSVTLNVQMMSKKWSSTTIAFPSCEPPQITKMSFVTNEQIMNKAFLLPYLGSMSPSWGDFDYSLLAL